MSRDKELPPMIAVMATMHADELHTDQPPRASVRLRPSGEVKTARRGVPPTGMQSGCTYRDVELCVRITVDPDDENSDLP